MTLQSMMLKSDIVLFLTCFPLWISYIFVSLMMPEKLIFSHVRKPHLSKHLLRKILQKHPALAPKPRVGFEAEVMQKLQHPNIVTLGFWWKQKDTNTSYILPLSLALYVASSQNIYIYIHKSMFFFTTWNCFFFFPWICVPKFKHTLWGLQHHGLWIVYSFLASNHWKYQATRARFFNPPEEAAASHGGRRTCLDCRKLLSFAEPDSTVKTTDRNNDSFMGSVP